MHEKDIFQFKYFSVQQDLCAMKVGTDGVLLGAWADAKDKQNVLDAGTGTGLLALMLAQRFSNIIIDAIDVDRKAYEQAIINVQACKMKDAQKRIQVFQSSLQEWQKSSGRKYDLIICNPPYFFLGFPVDDAERNKARAAENLTQDDLIEATKYLLSEAGSLQLIYPVQEGDAFLKKCFENNLHCKRETTVFAKEHQPAKRMLLEIVKYDCKTLEEELVIEHAGQHNYTEQYKTLTKDFYLNF